MSYKAFVSSTYEDLKEHRAHVIRALRRAGFFVDPMEDWPADSDEPKRFSQDRLNGCDLCVLLVAFRRGYVPEGEIRSITQLEYDAAVKQGIDIVPFLLDEQAAWYGKFDEREKDPALKAWRDHLGKRHGREVFTLEPRSIDLTAALGRWFGKKNAGETEQAPIQLITWPEGESPYPGLLSFDQKYAELFFGRDREVDAVLAKMGEPEGRVLIISGVSGSGKSSLVAAGLWHALKEGRLQGSEQWVWLRIQPGDGQRPFDPLVWGLKQAFPRIATRPQDLATELAAKKTAMGELLATQMAQGQELVLFIDQLEELFTSGFKDDEISNYLEQLVAIARDARYRLRVVATVRSEFIGRLGESDAIRQTFNAGYNYYLGPVSPRTLEDMIEKPAQATGYEFELGLVDEILRDAAQEPGSLPLVAYALKQLFERRQGRTFTRDAYNAINGIAGAIGTQADQEMDTLDEQARGAFDTVFAELVHLERERPPTRSRAVYAGFSADPNAMHLIQALAGQDCRVLVTSGSGQETIIEVAHEKLFSAWKKLKDWIENSDADLRLIDFEEECAKRWHEKGCRVQSMWGQEQAAAVQRALRRFKKTPSAQLKTTMHPQETLIERLNDASLSHQDRLLIGRKLAEFGDPRPGVVVLRPDGVPDIEWVEIPQGHIQLEDSDHVFVIKPFRMAKYPVTNSQFQHFIDDGGYEHDAWWEGIEKQPPTPSAWQEANCPRETVSWFEAVAFCRWLSAQTGTTIRLPTEWEWQEAATGGDSTRTYPWPGEWDAAWCNSSESRLNRTTAVGMYPSGATSQGLQDMAGNVWEWCLNTYERPESPESVRIDNDPNKRRVVRGGSWNYEPEFLRASNRYWYYAAYRNNDIGFRLVHDMDP